MEIDFSKFELDLMILALDKAASRFESIARLSEQRSSPEKVKEHSSRAANMRRLMHRLESKRGEIHQAEQKRWNKLAEQRRVF